MDDKDAEIAKWAKRAHDAESALVMFDALHAEGKFLHAAVQTAFAAMANMIRVATPNGYAQLIAFKIPDNRVLMIEPTTLETIWSFANDTRMLMAALHTSAVNRWATHFFVLISQPTLERTIANVAEMRLWARQDEQAQALVGGWPSGLQPGAKS